MLYLNILYFVIIIIIRLLLLNYCFYDFCYYDYLFMIFVIMILCFGCEVESLPTPLQFVFQLRSVMLSGLLQRPEVHLSKVL